MFKQRIRKLLLPVLILLITTLALPSHVYAGGWVVITLDQMPTHIIAGQPYKLGMMALQHGQTPWIVPELRVDAKQVETGQTATFLAKSDQQDGHYTVELLFPEPGRWEWGIQSGLYPTLQPMPAVEVARSASSGAAGIAAASMYLPQPNMAIRIAGVLALLALVIGAALIIRYRTQKTLRSTGIGLSVVAGLLLVVFISYANAQARRVQPIPVSGADPEMGQQLFLAKGCVVCHVNTRAIANAETYSVSFGPDLSTYQNDPEYLRQFLADPKGTKTTSQMPDLGLSGTEIDALIRFLNDQSEK